MLYSNKFTIATDDTKSEAVLNFLQQSPIINGETGNIDGTTTEPLASIVLNGDGLKALSKLIDGILSDMTDESAG